MRSSHKFSRRHFLVQSASLAGASLGLGATRAARGDEPRGDEPGEGSGWDARLGFVGLGDRGRDLLARALACREARVVGLCDPDPGKLKRALDMARAHRPKGYTDCRALFDSGDVEAVFISTPVYLHHKHTVAALAAGKHVYCEKPMAATAGECREVLDACREAEASGQLYQIGLQRRYSPRYRDSLRFIQEGGAGKILFVRAQWHAVGAARKSKPWLFRREKSGDIVLEQACHQFDIFNWIFAATPVAACGLGGSHGLAEGPPDTNTLDHYGAVLEYPGGCKVHYSHLTYAVPERRFSGIYELAFGERAGVDLTNGLAWDRSGRTRQLSREGGNETQLAVAGFLRSLIRGERPGASADVGFRATLAALLCRRALECDRRVAWEDVLPA
jgi:predicted dehydrogenase